TTAGSSRSSTTANRPTTSASSPSSGSPRPRWPTPHATASGSPPADLHPTGGTMTDRASSDRLGQLSDAGVSIWLDDLSRERIETGNLAELIRDKNVVGVTTNPTIFAGAIADGERYDEQVRKLVAEGADVARVIFEITTEDVRNGCEIMTPVFESTKADGRVSIEVEPDLANDTEGTIA